MDVINLGTRPCNSLKSVFSSFLFIYLAHACNFHRIQHSLIFLLTLLLLSILPLYRIPQFTQCVGPHTITQTQPTVVSITHPTTYRSMMISVCWNGIALHPLLLARSTLFYNRHPLFFFSLLLILSTTSSLLLVMFLPNLYSIRESRPNTNLQWNYRQCYYTYRCSGMERLYTIAEQYKRATMALFVLRLDNCFYQHQCFCKKNRKIILRI